MKSKAWPRIKKVEHKNGTGAYLVDGRINGQGKRWFFPTRTEADTKAAQLRVERTNQGTSAIHFPEKLRNEAVECNQLLAPFGKSLRDAVAFYLPYVEATNRSCTAAELVAELLKVKAADGASQRYLQDLSSRLGQFASAFNGAPVAEITATEIDEWLRSLPVAPSTRNNFRRVLIVALNFAKARGYCLTNHAEAASKAKEIEGEVEILTVKELTRLLATADAEIIPFIAIGAFAGLRRAELARLDWAEVDLVGATIRVMAKKAKSAKRRFVNIEPTLAAWIGPHARTKGAVTPSNYRELLDAARTAAGIEKWPQNGLRHSFASYHLAKFDNANALALQLGHTNSNLLFNTYRQAVKPADAARYWQIAPSAEAGQKIIATIAA